MPDFLRLNITYKHPKLLKGQTKIRPLNTREKVIFQESVLYFKGAISAKYIVHIYYTLWRAVRILRV